MRKLAVLTLLLICGWSFRAATANSFLLGVLQQQQQQQAAGTVISVVESVTETDSGVTLYETGTVAFPSTRPSSDLYIIIICRDGGQAWTAPATVDEVYNVVDTTAPTSPQIRFGIYTLKTTETPPASVDFTWTGGENFSAAVWRVSNTGGRPSIGAKGSNEGYGDTSPISPTINTTADNTLIMRAAGSDRDVFTATPTTERHINDGTSTGLGHTASSSEAGPASGNATGTATFTLNVDDEWVAVTVEIKPPGA